ncbi:MAG: hypothetical protein H7Y89_09195 [Steroidobacteraceae bacterium]|nr:hypothetical protein [Steroidobacteraceae bacterium]
MKTVLGLMLIAAATVWGWPAIALSDNAAIGYLDALEALSMQGRAEEYCEHMHEDVTVSVSDATSMHGAVRIEGGKKEWCDYIAFATKGMSLLGMESQVTRNGLTVTRSWRHPWTAEVSYEEQRTSTMTRVNATLRTESADQWTLVQTLSGIKVLRLKVDSRIAR